MTLRDRSKEQGAGKKKVREVPFEARFHFAHRMLQDALALRDAEIKECGQCAAIVSAEVIRVANGTMLKRRAVEVRTIALTQQDFIWPQAPRTLVTSLSNSLYEQHTQHVMPEEW